MLLSISTPHYLRPDCTMMQLFNIYVVAFVLNSEAVPMFN